MKDRIFVNAFSCISALGRGDSEQTENLRLGTSPGMGTSETWRKNGAKSYVGRVLGDLPAVTEKIHDTRNNRILQSSIHGILTAIKTRLGVIGPELFALVAGTSTSGIAETETAMFSSPPGCISCDYDYSRQEFGSPAAFVRDLLGVEGPAYALSTACTSSTNAFISARRLLLNGQADAVLVIGADSLCRTTVEGFISLEAVSDERCLPMSVNRRGINIGEGAGVFLLSRERGPIELLGAGESCDAFHLSSPDPQGRGAEAAMRASLTDAGLSPEEIDYVNLHATGTIKNDEMESLAMSRVFPSGVICSGTKALTGHALGAAGAIEAAICCLAIRHDFIPRHVWDGQPDPKLPPVNLCEAERSFGTGSRRICMTNNFAFGGSNVSLIFGASS
jgi:3-oxoacyl-[acyl-carrier-protein] synthase-1